jgi:transcription antitermination factor NusG
MANFHLENAGYESFLPVAKCTHRSEQGVEELEVPLFPGYLFCRMNPHYRLPVLRTPGVIQIVGAGEMPIPVEEQEVTAIQRVAKSGLASMPWPYLRAVRVARIEEGPLKGLTGIAVKLKFGMKLVLSVNVLQRSVAVEIDRRWIGDAVATRPALNGRRLGTPTAGPLDGSVDILSAL